MPRLLSRLKLGLAATLTATTCLAVSLPSATFADSDAGAYLAARHADMAGNFPEMIEFGISALANDPSNASLLEGVVIAHTALGRVDDALPYARKLAAEMPQSQISGLVLLGNALKDEDWATAEGLLGDGVSIAPAIDTMMQAWINIGQGKMSKAITVFDALAEEENSRTFALFQKALALALVGDFEGSAFIFGGGEEQLQLNRRGLIAYAQVLAQLDRHEDALTMLDMTFGDTADLDLSQLRSQLEAGDKPVFSGITSPNDGIAELLFVVAEGLGTGADPTVVLLYNRMAEFLNPKHEGSIILSAQVLERMEHYDLAVETYSKIEKDSASYPTAALGRTDVLRRWGKLDEASVELRALAETYPDALRFRVALGDLLLRQDRFAEARAEYDTAIAGFSAPLPAQWATYYQRAIAAHKLDDWPAAEADFRQALELSPGHPNVLNYLGYSLVERQEKLDEALEMIEQAVEARPESGFIVDSLGWVQFRLGRYDEAVLNMERAVELMPVDPILNDHLGDTYWAVGRVREAEFQWSRALSFITEETDLGEIDPDRIRRKLDVGLDVVLDDEGAAPLHDE